MKKSKAQNGDANYTSKDEKYDRKRLKNEEKSMKTAGLATALKKSQGKGKAKLPKVKPSKKMGC